MKLESERKEKEGRVKFQIQNHSYEEEEAFDQAVPEKPPQAMSFIKKKPSHKAE
jgi:hypothetical protein